MMSLVMPIDFVRRADLGLFSHVPRVYVDVCCITQISSVNAVALRKIVGFYWAKNSRG